MRPVIPEASGDTPFLTETAAFVEPVRGIGSELAGETAECHPASVYRARYQIENPMTTYHWR